MAQQNKNDNLLLVAGIVALFLLFKKKSPITATNNPEVKAAANDAKQLANDFINQTTFLPDTTTDEQRYKNSLNQCV